MTTVNFPISGTGSRFGVNVLDFGADPTGVNDSVAAFEAAMMAQANLVAGGGTPGNNYGEIRVPLGWYKFSRACNLDIAGPSVAYCFRGEGQATGHIQGGSLIVGPNDDYAFKSTGNDPNQPGVGGNVGNTAIFERLMIMGWGGIYLNIATPSIRDCAFACWRSIVVPSCWAGSFENIILRPQNNPAWVPADPGDLNKGQVGIFAFCGPNGTFRNIDAAGFAYGTAVALGGVGITFDTYHCEVSRVGLFLGLAPNINEGLPNQQAGLNYISTSSFKQFGFEGNLIGVIVGNCSLSELMQWNMQMHSDPYPEGPLPAFCGVAVFNSNGSRMEAMQIGGQASQAAIVTDANPFPDGSSRNPMMARNLLYAGYMLQPGTYPAGTTVLPLVRGKSKQLPSWLVPGVSVMEPGGSTSKVPAGTTVTAVDLAANTITLSQPTTAPMAVDANLNGDWLLLPCPAGNALNGFAAGDGGSIDTGYPFLGWNLAAI